jgi:hypothetical protein
MTYTMLKSLYEAIARLSNRCFILKLILNKEGKK